MGLELKIIPVKPYVHMRYIPVHGKEKYCDMMRELSGANDKGRFASQRLLTYDMQ